MSFHSKQIKTQLIQSTILPKLRYVKRHFAKLRLAALRLIYDLSTETRVGRA